MDTVTIGYRPLFIIPAFAVMCFVARFSQGP